MEAWLNRKPGNNVKPVQSKQAKAAAAAAASEAEAAPSTAAGTAASAAKGKGKAKQVRALIGGLPLPHSQLSSHLPRYAGPLNLNRRIGTADPNRPRSTALGGKVPAEEH